MNTQRLIDKRVMGWQNRQNAQHLTVVGEYGVIEASPEKRQDAERYHQQVRPIVERQLAIRGDSKPFTFKAHGFKWAYRPGVSDAE